MKKVLMLTKVDETKGALRYAEVLPGGRICKMPNEPGATIGVQYIRKSALLSEGLRVWPQTLKLTLETEDRLDVVGITGDVGPAPSVPRE